jgi:hypothetical protein
MPLAARRPGAWRDCLHPVCGSAVAATARAGYGFNVRVGNDVLAFQFNPDNSHPPTAEQVPATLTTIDGAGLAGVVAPPFSLSAWATHSWLPPVLPPPAAGITSSLHTLCRGSAACVQVIGYWGVQRAAYPNATLSAGTLDDFAALAWAQRDTLPHLNTEVCVGAFMMACVRCLQV